MIALSPGSDDQPDVCLRQEDPLLRRMLQNGAEGRLPDLSKQSKNRVETFAVDQEIKT